MKSQELLITSDLDLQECYETLSNALKGTRNGLQVVVKENILKRSVLQNAFYWACCNEIAKFLEDAGLYFTLQGEKMDYNKDVVHMINKSHTGIESTTKMDVKAFIEFVEGVQDFWVIKTNGFYNPEKSARREAEKWKNIK